MQNDASDGHSLASSLPLLRQRNGGAPYGLTGAQIEGSDNFSKNPILLRIQFFQPFSHFNPAFFKSFARLAVWTVDFQESQQVTL
jgi:hypothetical protein